MMIKSLQANLEKAGQENMALHTELKFKVGIAKMQDEGQTRRVLMKETNDAHEREITQAQKQHDTETYALTAQNVAEINGIVRILTSKTEHAHRMREMLTEFEHDVTMQDKQLAVKSEQAEPVGTVLQ